MHFELESNSFPDIWQHLHMLRLHFYQLRVAHFDKSLILLNHWWQVSQLEMHVGVCVTHRPLFLVTFHLSRYIGVRYLPPALSECGVLMSRESWQALHRCGLPATLCTARQRSPVRQRVHRLFLKQFLSCLRRQKIIIIRFSFT